MYPSATDIEKWVRIRTVLDLLAVTITAYKEGKLSNGQLLSGVRNAIAEVYGMHGPLDKILKIVEEAITGDQPVEIVDIVRKAQKVLVNYEFGGEAV